MCIYIYIYTYIYIYIYTHTFTATPIVVHSVCLYTQVFIVVGMRICVFCAEVSQWELSSDPCIAHVVHGLQH